MSAEILRNFYSCVVESILTIPVWYGEWQRQLRGSSGLHSPLCRASTTAVHRRAASIIKDPIHPQHGLFTLLPSGHRYRSVKCRTTRLNSFFPTAIRLHSNCTTKYLLFSSVCLYFVYRTFYCIYHFFYSFDWSKGQLSKFFIVQGNVFLLCI